MTYQKQDYAPDKSKSAPMYSSAWLALFMLLRASLQSWESFGRSRSKLH